MSDIQKGDPLTAREAEVLERIGQGDNSKEVGAHLGISARTVDCHRSHIMTKLGARNAVHMVALALTSHAAPPAPRTEPDYGPDVLGIERGEE